MGANETRYEILDYVPKFFVMPDLVDQASVMNPRNFSWRS